MLREVGFSGCQICLCLTDTSLGIFLRLSCREVILFQLFLQSRDLISRRGCLRFGDFERSLCLILPGSYLFAAMLKV